jgi:hypothetical protein
MFEFNKKLKTITYTVKLHFVYQRGIQKWFEYSGVPFHEFSWKKQEFVRTKFTVFNFLMYRGFFRILKIYETIRKIRKSYDFAKIFLFFYEIVRFTNFSYFFLFIFYVKFYVKYEKPLYIKNRKLRLQI